VSAPGEVKETGRIEAFSDGVFAIAITLLVLELKVPHLPEGSPAGALAAALARQWPSYVALVTSFSTILIMWANHHAIFGMVRRIDAPFLYANGLLLLVVTVVPFPTAVLAEYFERPGASVAAAAYGGTFVLAGVAYNLLWRSAIAGKLFHSDVSEERVRERTRRYRLGVPLYLAATAGAYWSVYITVGICVALAIVWIGAGVRG
jgi:uncharacterized membrane protein